MTQRQRSDMEMTIDSIYDSFSSQLSDGEASFKDLFYNGMLTVVLLVNEELESGNVDGVINLIKDIESAIDQKSIDYEVDTTYLYEALSDEESDDDEEDFVDDEEDDEGIEESDDDDVNYADEEE